MTEMKGEKNISAGMTINQVLEGLPIFEPIAYYDKHLDAIRVQTKDCSIWEERLDPIMTVYHANHHLQPDGLNDIVGFCVKGVRHLLQKVGVERSEGPVEIAEFLDKLFKHFPSGSTKRVVEIYRGFNEPRINQVEVPPSQAA